VSSAEGKEVSARHRSFCSYSPQIHWIISRCGSRGVAWPDVTWRQVASKQLGELVARTTIEW